MKQSKKKTKNFFNTTSYGSNVPVYAVSAKFKTGLKELKDGILSIVNSIDIMRDVDGEIVIPIDHHFPIKGMGAVLTGTLLSGNLKLNQILDILPINASGRVKSIQIFRQNVDSAKAGDRLGINIRGIDINKVYRGCYATSDRNVFDFCDIIEVQVNNNKLFKPKTHFGTQVHVTIGILTTVGNIYPYFEEKQKRIQTSVSNKENGFKALLILKEKVLIRKKKTVLLLSRLDLPPTNLRKLEIGRVNV